MSEQAQPMGLSAPPRASTNGATCQDEGAPSSSLAPARTASTDINNGILEGEPSRKRMKPSSSSGEISPAPGTSVQTGAAAGASAGATAQPSSSAKRRGPGILSTALGWARSQAADLATFQETKAAQGPEKPLPPLPLPTRRLAAAHHDMMKASQHRTTHRRGAGGGASGGSSTLINSSDLLNQQQQHPVTVAFATGTDPQLASVLGAELARLGDLAQADPEKYAALAEECKLWAAGTTASVAGLTASDLEKAQLQLKDTMRHAPPMPPSGSGGRGGGGIGAPRPDPRASSYFIQPGTGRAGTGAGNRNSVKNGDSNAATTHNHHLFNNYSQYYQDLNGIVTGNHHHYYNNMISGGGTGGGTTNNGTTTVNHRYPRRSSRAQKAKNDDLYLTLDSEDEAEDNNRDEDDEEEDRYGDEDGSHRGGWSRNRGREMKRGPGRPRKQSVPPPPPSYNTGHYHHYQEEQQQQYQRQQQQQQQQQFSPNIMSLQHPSIQRVHQQSRMTPSISPAVANAALAGAVAGSLAYFSPQLGADVLSPFAQFLFEHNSPDGTHPIPVAAAGGGATGGIIIDDPALNNATGVLRQDILPPSSSKEATAGNATAAAAGGADGDAVDTVDYAALDDFISGLNFTNDAFVGSPSAMTMLAGVKAAVAATTEALGTAAAGTISTAAVPAGMIPTIEAGGAITYTNPSSVPPETAGTTTTAPPPHAPLLSSTANADGQPTNPNPTSPSLPPPPSLPQPVLPILDLAICKPLETPTVAGMLSLGVSKKSPTPLTSPLLSPTLMALNF